MHSCAKWITQKDVQWPSSIVAAAITDRKNCFFGGYSSNYQHQQQLQQQQQQQQQHKNPLDHWLLVTFRKSKAL